jgi:hypothetical protein
LGHSFKFVFIEPRQVFNAVRWRNKLNLVYLSHYLACILCFVVFFADVPRFIIKQAMGVSHPRHSTEENTKKRINTKKFPVEKVTYIVSSPGGFLTAV